MNLPTIGDIFEGRYRLDAVLGEGGFGIVFAVIDVDSHQSFALKVLKPEADGYDDTTRRRFEREAKALRRLCDPHTVRLFEHGESATGLLYMRFELLAGEDLSAVLTRRGRLEPGEVVHVMRQLLQALAEAHRSGVLHRDIKPANVRVVAADDGLSVKLIDFGIGRLTDDGSPAITRAGELIGTPRYMSPEQLTERPLTGASDIYSLGMVMLELLLGSDALHGNRWSDQLDRLRTGHIFTLPGLERTGAGLLSIITRMTAREPARRFGSAEAALSALDGLERDPTEPVPTASHAARPSRFAVVALASVLLVVLGIAAFYWSRPEPSVRVPARLPRALVSQPASQDLGLAAPAAPDTDLSDAAQPGPCGLPAYFEGSDRLPGTDMFVPRGYDPHHRHPLLVLLNDDYQDPALFLAQSGFEQLAQDHRFIVIAPSDPGGVKLIHASVWRNDARAVSSIKRAIAHAESMFCIDSARVFVVGNGRGGEAAQWFACDPQVKAFATYAHPWWGALSDCPAEVSRPFLALLPNGGEQTDRCKQKGVEPAEIEAKWRKRNGCRADDPEVTPVGSSSCSAWNCDTKFETCDIDGGRLWPGSRRTAAMACLGTPPSSSFPAAEHIWKFFASVED